MDEVPTSPDVLRKRALEEVESRFEEHTASVWRRRLKDAAVMGIALIALGQALAGWAFILGPEGLGRIDRAGPLSTTVWWFGLACILAGGGVAVLELTRTMRWERERIAEIERVRNLPRHDPRPRPLPDIDPEATPLDPTREVLELP